MVEPWSSKPLAWVRFLLLLITLVKHTATNALKKRHKNYRGRKSSLFAGSKASFFITNLASSARRVASTKPSPTNRPLIAKISYHNYKLSSSYSHKYLTSNVQTIPHQATWPYYRYAPSKFKRLVATSTRLQLLAVVGKGSFYGYLLNITFSKLLETTFHNFLNTEHGPLFHSTKVTGLRTYIPFTLNSPLSRSVLPGHPRQLSRMKGVAPVVTYTISAKIFHSSTTTLNFVKLLSLHQSLPRLTRMSTSPYLVRRKGLFRGLQNTLVATTFSRFYNYRVKVRDVLTSSQVVTKHQLTRSDN